MPVDPRVAKMVAERSGRPMPQAAGRPLPAQAAGRPPMPDAADGVRPMPRSPYQDSGGNPMPPGGMPAPGMPPQYKKGGSVKNLFKGKESMSEELKEAKAIKSGKITPMQYAKGEKSEDKKKGKPFAKGGSVRGDGLAQRGKTKGRMC